MSSIIRKLGKSLYQNRIIPIFKEFGQVELTDIDLIIIQLRKIIVAKGFTIIISNTGTTICNMADEPIAVNPNELLALCDVCEKLIVAMRKDQILDTSPKLKLKPELDLNVN